MAGRIRTIKPEWLDDERMTACSSDARVLSIALLLMADDYGNGRCQKSTNSARVFPPSGDSLESLQSSYRRFDEALLELVGMRFAGLYEVDGQHYFAIRNWSKHQKVNHPGKPLVPGPPETLWNDSRESPESLFPDRYQRPTTNDQRPGEDPPRAPVCDLGSSALPVRRFTESLMSDPPDSLEFTEEHREIAKAGGLDIEECWKECRDYRRGQGQRSANWDASFSSWLRNERKRGKKTGKTEEKPTPSVTYPNAHEECKRLYRIKLEAEKRRRDEALAAGLTNPATLPQNEALDPKAAPQ